MGWHAEELTSGKGLGEACLLLPNVGDHVVAAPHRDGQTVKKEYAPTESGFASLEFDHSGDDKVVKIRMISKSPPFQMKLGILAGEPFAGFCRDPLYRGGLDVVRKEVWPSYRSSSGVRLWWELKEPKGPKRAIVVDRHCIVLS